jgi:hypothetical protein
MKLIHVATLIVGMLLLAQSAAAQTCMCAETGLELPLSAADVDAVLLQDALDALDSQAASSGEALAAPTEGSDELPWCTSQNQAECSKRPVGSTPSPVSIGSSPTAATSALLRLPSSFSTACHFAEYSSGGPRDAVRSKLERPPQ